MTSPLTGVFQMAIETASSSVVIGEGTTGSDVTFVSIEGLGSQVVGSTSKRALAGGVAVGFDSPGSRMLAINLEIACAGDPDTAMGWWMTLDTAFAAIEDQTAMRRLWLWLPGSFGHREMVGRPRGMTDDGLARLPYGWIEPTCSFEVTTGDLGTPVVVTP